MKIVFAGPSLHGLAFDRHGIEIRPPAAQGDVTRAVLEGAASIGIIDGVFGAAAAVWHREILHALSAGVRVLGASSMGALRAAECAPYGMEPVGEIAHRYAEGRLDDDAAVALTFGPAELGYCPLTEPLVDVTSRLEQMLGDRLLSGSEAAAVAANARRLFFADRTVERLFGDAGLRPARARELGLTYAELGPSAKQRDALELLHVIRQARPRPPVIPAWRLAEPPFWRDVLSRLSHEVNRVTIESR